METQSKDEISYDDNKVDEMSDLEQKLKRARRVKFDAVANEFKRLNQPEITKLLNESGFTKKAKQWEDPDSKTGNRSTWWCRQVTDHLYRKGVDWSREGLQFDDF